MRAVTALSLLLVVSPRALYPQATTSPLCYHARPKPACSAFILTSFGTYVLLGSGDFGGTPFREVADWGAMVNVGQKDAIGGSVFASLDRSGLTVGPAARYRHWLSASASVEVALGTPLMASTQDLQPGSVFGLVKWSPNDWFSVAARPELGRWTSLTSCGPAGCQAASRMHGRMSVGIELGRVPGAVFTGLGTIGTYFLALALANSD